MNASKLIRERGWICIECIQPVVGGVSWQAGHMGFNIQDRPKCAHDYGSKVLAEAGNAYYLAPLHD